MKKELAVATAAALCVTFGCIQVKTESEIKPIHITMDVNLKVDKELDKAFSDETQQSPRGDFKAIRDAMSRGVAGMNSNGLLEERSGATDDDKILIAEDNARRMKRFRDIAKSSGTTLEAVQQRHASRMRTRLPSGAWYQTDDGKWTRKN